MPYVYFMTHYGIVTTFLVLHRAEEGAKELYALRTHEGWTTFSHCGFVVSVSGRCRRDSIGSMFND